MGSVRIASPCRTCPPPPAPSPRGGGGNGHGFKIHGSPVDSPACGSRHWRVHVVKGGQTDARTTTGREAVPMAKQRKCRGTPRCGMCPAECTAADGERGAERLERHAQRQPGSASREHRRDG